MIVNTLPEVLACMAAWSRQFTDELATDTPEARLQILRDVALDVSMTPEQEAVFLAKATPAIAFAPAELFGLRLAGVLDQVMR